MRVISGRGLVILGALLLLLPSLEARAGNESEILAQGTAALERKQCDKAYWTLQRMPAPGRTDVTWLLTTARAAECLKRYDDALLFYRKYSRAEPGNPVVVEKIAQMNMLLDQETKKRCGSSAVEENSGKKVVDDAVVPSPGGAANQKQASPTATTVEPFAAAATAATAPFGAAVAPAASSSSGTAGGGEMHEVPAYSGKYASDVSQLLQRSPSPWKTPSCITCNDGVPPKVPESLPCQRDSYVYAALTSAWAVESYARVGEPAKAESTATLVRQNLDNADSLCSNAPTPAPGVACVTLDIWPCR